jgi:hypothetical protein
MLRKLSVVLALALCTGWSTAQAAQRLHPDTIKALAEAIALASKEVLAAPPSKLDTPSLFVKVNDGLKLAAETVKSLAILVGVPVVACHWYEPCNETATRVGASLHIRDPDNDHPK